MPASAPTLRHKLYVVIFEHHTVPGKAFDVALLVTVLVSVTVVVVESVPTIAVDHRGLLRQLEWLFTGMFTLEYLLRLYAAPDRWRYTRSFFGLVDLLAVLPTYVGILVPGAHELLVVRVLRLLRVFRVLKLGNYGGEADALLTAIRASLPKITVFIAAVASIVVIAGATMHLVEGPEHGFSDIPRSMYWAIVTLTTVGYGDLAPQTTLGRGLASLLMILGYGIIAVPTGIVSAELVRASPGRPASSVRRCAACGVDGHAADATWCRRCAAKLPRG
jgi:voltage-gated potassium channel